MQPVSKANGEATVQSRAVAAWPSSYDGKQKGGLPAFERILSCRCYYFNRISYFSMIF